MQWSLGGLGLVCMLHVTYTETRIHCSANPAYNAYVHTTTCDMKVGLASQWQVESATCDPRVDLLQFYTYTRVLGTYPV